MAAAKKHQLHFHGNIEDHSVLVGNHGDTVINVDGNFNISGIIYSPKYTVTFVIEGDGKIAMRGICDKIVIKKMSGSCTLDLTDLTCKVLSCESMRDQSKLLAGKTRVISKAILKDEAVIQLMEKPLMTSLSITSGNSRIIQPSETE